MKQRKSKAKRQKTAPKATVKSASKKKSAKKKSAKKKSAGMARPADRSSVKAASATRRGPADRRRGSSAAHMQASSNPRTIFELLYPGAMIGTDPHFRDAPDGWTPERARMLAVGDGLDLVEDHWEVIRVLQGCYKDELQPRIRLLRDALEARFADKGGMKYLFVILPGGPIAQGCALAGVKPPHGATDLSFGSVA